MPYGFLVDFYPAIAFGIDLQLTSTEDGGRSVPLMNISDRLWMYRPNWGLPSMAPTEQSGAPVLGFSGDLVLPGESVHAVIVTLFPDMVAQWDLEVVSGVVLPLYEGARVCGHGTVLWRTHITLPLGEHDKQRFLRWLEDPGLHSVIRRDAPTCGDEGSCGCADVLPKAR